MKPIHLRIAAVVILIGALGGCAKPPEAPPPTPPPPARVEKPSVPHISLVKLQENFLKNIDFRDDGDQQSLIKAAKESLSYLDKLPSSKLFKAGDVEFSAAQYAEALRKLLAIMEKRQISVQDVISLFDVYAYKVEIQDTSSQSRPGEGVIYGTGQVLATGYYEPILEGNYRPSKEYSYPIYPVPENLIKVSLDLFNVNCGDVSTIVGRVEGHKLVPYYSRREIDEGALKGTQPLVWVKNPVDAFFLQVQGSGIIRFPDGTERRLGYGSGNGRPYRSIGKYMIDQGWMSKDEVSMQAIKAYLMSHPDKLWPTLWYNENYVFFRWVEEGPKGSLNVFLTPERSIASDRRFYPPATLSFISTVVPDGHYNYKPFNRWVFHQDAGGAIKGPGRVDIFFGSGNEAGEKAGRMKYQGTLLLFLPKN
jgi:membrane-bound lytic murein transglycosylase A